MRLPLLVSALAAPWAAHATCASPPGNEGDLRYASNHKAMVFCNGTHWVAMGASPPDQTLLVPAGAVVGFALTACPAGWSEYTPARGRFLRGRDNGAGIDPDGTRAPGNVQADALQNITGTFATRLANTGYGITFEESGAFAHTGSTATITTRVLLDPGLEPGEIITFDASRMARTANETRPKNVAVLFCRKD